MLVNNKNKFFSRFVASIFLLLFMAWILVSKDITSVQTQIIQVKSGASMGVVAARFKRKKTN